MGKKRGKLKLVMAGILGLLFCKLMADILLGNLEDLKEQMEQKLKAKKPVKKKKKK